jgi:hypothetical protein
VCTRGFALAYNISYWYLEDIIVRLEKGHVNCLPELNPVVPIALSEDKKLSDSADQFGIALTPEQIGSLHLRSLLRRSKLVIQDIYNSSCSFHIVVSV